MQHGPAINTQDIKIGARSLGGDFFNGYIDEVMLFNRALNPTETQQIHNG